MMHLRSVELQMPDRQAAVDFLKGPWGLVEVGSRGDTSWLRGTAARHYAVAVTGGPARAVLSATVIGALPKALRSLGLCLEGRNDRRRRLSKQRGR